MARLIQVIGTLDGNVQTSSMIQTLPVKSGAVASIKTGYLVIKDGSNAGYVAAAPDATDSDSVILGVALCDSSDTASADGVVTIVAASVLLIKIFAKTPGSLAATMPFSKYILDVTAGSYTLDQATTTKGIFRMISYDNTSNGLCIATLATNW